MWIFQLCWEERGKRSEIFCNDVKSSPLDSHAFEGKGGICAKEVGRATNRRARVEEGREIFLACPSFVGTGMLLSLIL